MCTIGHRPGVESLPTPKLCLQVGNHSLSTAVSHPAIIHQQVCPFLTPETAVVGKTSLMSALAGKASYGTVTGSVTINGKPDKLLRYKRVMGFVPQVSPAMNHALKLLVYWCLYATRT